MKRLDEVTSTDFFYCYTKSLSLFLKEKGIPYIIKANSIKDGNTFTLYVKCAELQKALDDYMLKVGQ
ncbi:hypothetical protein [Planococcus halotolerans]|uniref:DUF5659 domain-containing protein n=1 Tax=Planococcus halotolerans TaxID=2233542 RepID=A0A365KM09_9BACL|nr:hypothetical protein [Planococcus halotolerans]QHJ71624.1 hypothetical protein DNR44_013740 [Planococcus halotolerans]RAZ74159.1 hypothetical protein DP120_16400 [Planococcus halotolerans]